MKVRIEQLAHNMCAIHRPNLECVYFMKRGAISSDGMVILVIPYAEGDGPKDGDEIIAVNHKECERVARFFKKHLIKDETINLTVSENGNDLVFQAGGLFPVATIIVPRTLGIDVPNFDSVLDSPRPDSSFMFSAELMIDAIKATCGSDNCTNARIFVNPESSYIVIEPVGRENGNSKSMSTAILGLCHRE